MLHGIRGFVMLAALGMAVACGRASARGVVSVVTPALIPSTATTPDAPPGAEPTPFTTPGVSERRDALWRSNGDPLCGGWLPPGAPHSSGTESWPLRAEKLKQGSH
jgi:hypothetical protein